MGEETYASDRGTEFENEDKYVFTFETITTRIIAFPDSNRKIRSDQSAHGTVSEYQGFIGDEAVKPRSKGRKKKFAWKLTGYSECTKTCGGGAAIFVTIPETRP